MDTTWDCIIIGGGAAGLSAALVLGRARRRTLVIDAGRQSNLPAHGIGGLLGHNEASPADFYARARREVLAHPTVEIRDTTALGAAPAGRGFTIGLADGTSETARRILLAGGMDYAYPSLRGIDTLWGDTVFHCPFCHGWEVRNGALGVLDDGDSGVHRATLLSAWSDDVTLLTNGPTALSAEQAESLRAAGITIDERVVQGLRAPGGKLQAAEFVDGEERALDGLLVPITLHQRDDLAAQLGVAFAEPGPMSGEAVAVDAMHATNVEGVFAAGDVAGQMPTVPNSVAGGHKAAAMIVGSLVAERAAAAPNPA